MGVVGKKTGRFLRLLALVAYLALLIPIAFGLGPFDPSPTLFLVWGIWGMSWLYWLTQATGWTLTPNRHQQPAR